MLLIKSKLFYFFIGIIIWINFLISIFTIIPMIILTVHNNRLEVFLISSIAQIIWLVLIIFLGLLIKHPKVKWFESFDKLNKLIQ